MATETRAAMSSAMAAMAQGRFEEAESIFQTIQGSVPSSGEILLFGGIVAARMNRRIEAIKRLENALRLDPRIAPAHYWLGVLLLEEGRADEALTHASVAYLVRPEDPQVQLSYGLSLLEAGKASHSIPPLELALGRQPENPTLWHALAKAYESVGRDIDSAEALHKAASLAPTVESWLRLADALTKIGRSAEALKATERALELVPDSARAHLAASRANADLFQDEEAFRHLDLAALHSTDAGFIALRRAQLLQMRGRFSEANAELEAAIGAQPSLGSAYQSMVATRTVTDADRTLIERIENALKRPDISPGDEASLHYALAKSWDDLGNYAEAMSEYDRANVIEFERRVKGKAVNEGAVASEINARIRTFGRGLLRSQTSGSMSKRPIFIVGMPRSGTTLIEQILSCHPEVAGAGELGFWAQNEPQLVNFSTGILDLQAIRSAAATYLNLIDGFAEGEPYVTDKNPANCLALGVIHLALPEARIIRARRNAADTALSIYMTPWANPPGFVCDKGRIAFYYEQYLRLMEHWRTVLPEKNYLEISYEDLVRDGEPTIRRMLDFLELPWNAECMSHERNERTVRTPSFWQVRQPLYTSSVGRWERYRSFLGAFERLIDRDMPNRADY